MPIPIDEYSDEGFALRSFPRATVAAGIISGFTSIRKFGINIDIDTGTPPATIWRGSPALYPWQDSSFSAEVVSSSTADTSDGTGARTVRIQGLDADWNFQTEDITLNGQTAVDSALTWRRINRAFVLTAGSGATNAGTITVRLDGAGATQATIAAGLAQSQVCVYTVPAGHTVSIEALGSSIVRASNSANIEIGLLTREPGGVFRLRDQIGLRSAATSRTSFDLVAPIICPEMTDIDVRCLFASANTNRISATLSMFQIQNSLLPS